jgi:hypothetical protein
MVFWLFKKKSETSDHFENSVKNSFGNIKKDMSQITSWINHFHEKHGSHNEEIQGIIARLERIEESLLSFSNETIEEEVDEEVITNNTNPSYISKEYDKWDELTPVQQALSMKIYGLQKENPGKWLALKQIAQELYPNKEYSKVRSTVSDYIGVLEEFDYIERKRKGRQAYVRCKIKEIPQQNFLKQKTLN